MPPMDGNDRYLAAGPLSHAAMLPVWGTLDAGGAIVVMPAFHPAGFLELAQRRRCTTTMLVPTMIQMVIAQPQAREADLSSLRAVFYGAAPISERTLTDAIATWGNIMFQMYGQSEAVPLTVLDPDDHTYEAPGGGVSRLRSAGRPTPNTELRVIDAEGNELAVGEVGEIAARTPAAMDHIWLDPQATSERITPDGFVLTRDMGYLDTDGYLFLADRKEDMIISGGFNIWPAELENALASHPAVAEVAVVGIPHEKWGETPVAVVVLREGKHADEAELIQVEPRQGGRGQARHVGPVRRRPAQDAAGQGSAPGRARALLGGRRAGRQRRLRSAATDDRARADACTDEPPRRGWTRAACERCASRATSRSPRSARAAPRSACSSHR